jgi:hypothetical protein
MQPNYQKEKLENSEDVIAKTVNRENQKQKLQRLYLNPKFHSLVEMVDPKIVKHTNVVINYNNNTYINNINNTENNIQTHSSNENYSNSRTKIKNNNLAKIENLSNDIKSFSHDNRYRINYNQGNDLNLFHKKLQKYSISKPPERNIVVEKLNLTKERLFSKEKLTISSEKNYSYRDENKLIERAQSMILKFKFSKK